MSKIVIVQGSLNPDSKTAVVVKETEKVLKTRNIEFETLDLRSLELQFCDGRSLKDYNEDMQRAYRVLESADGFILGMPVYCWSMSGVVKNLIDITAGALENKVAGILCNAGGNRSFMSSGDLINVLYYESGVMTVHPVVYTSNEDFTDGKLIAEKPLAKIPTMIDALMKQVAPPRGEEMRG
jgi:NAD(P)H-dependent FMN reductase